MDGFIPALVPGLVENLPKLPEAVLVRYAGNGQYAVKRILYDYTQGEFATGNLARR